MKFIITLLATIISFNTAAFEYLGLTSGMTRDEVMKVPGWGNKKGTRLDQDYEVIFGGNRPGDLDKISLTFTPGSKRLYKMAIIVDIGNEYGRDNPIKIAALKQILIKLELKQGADGEIEDYMASVYKSSGRVNMPRLGAVFFDEDIYNEELSALESKLGPPFLN